MNEYKGTATRSDILYLFAILVSEILFLPEKSRGILKSDTCGNHEEGNTFFCSGFFLLHSEPACTRRYMTSLRSVSWNLFDWLESYSPRIDILPNNSLRVRSFWMIRIKIRINDSRSLGSCRVHQRNRWILDQSEFIGSFDAPWSEWSWITDPDPDHPKGTQPYIVEGTNKIKTAEKLDERSPRSLDFSEK